MPEKEYFSSLVSDVIAIWEGSHNITDTPNFGSDCWNWGNEVYLPGISSGFGNGPLHFWEIGNTGHVQNVVNPDSALLAVAPWQLNMMLFSLGRAEELGFQTTKLRQWAAKYLAGLLTDPDFSPYYCALYRLPTIRKIDSSHYQNWFQVRQSLDSINFNLTQDFFDNRNDVEHGYANIAMCASAFITDVENGSFAYNFTDTTLMNNPLLNNNPKWAIKTRNENLVVCQNILLQQNWNNISSPLLPFNADLNYIFEKNNIRLMKDDNGGIFFPEYGINTIGDWNVKKGYLLNVNSAQTLAFKGTKVNTQDYIYELPAGWSLISYIKQNPMTIETALNSIISNIVIVKDGYGGIFVPNWNINTIGNMLPNRGYWIFLNNSSDLIYPEN